MGLFVFAGYPKRDRNITAPRFSEHAVNNFRADLGVAKRRGDSQNLHLRAAQRQRHSKGIVNVVANIRVDDDLLGYSPAAVELPQRLNITIVARNLHIPEQSVRHSHFCV